MAFDLYNTGELLKQARKALDRGNLDQAESMIAEVSARRAATKAAPGRQMLVPGPASGEYRLVTVPAGRR